MTDADLAGSRYAFPLVGGLIGLALAGLSAALSWRQAAPGVVAFLLVAVNVVLTGGLHLDGLADTADGLFLHGGPERRLHVMRDPHVGSFGVAAVVLVILGKYAVLESFSESTRGWAILGAAVVGRSLVLVSAGLSGYARPQGTGRTLIEATTLRDALGAAGVILVTGGAVAGVAGLVSVLLVLVAAFGFTRLVAARLGGVTGDTLGAVVEAGELLFLAALGLASGGHESG